MKELTQIEIHRVLCYNPLSGNFIWKISPRFNIRIGSAAGGTIRRGRQLYRKITIYENQYLAHRLAFFYMRGYWPRDQIDHKDGNGLNNCWFNLRECNNSQNHANHGPHKDNKLGIKGVHRVKSGKYQPQICKDGKKVYLGYYDTPKAATCIYQKAAKRYFGEFAK